MLRVTDADAAAIVNRNPGCARRGVDERVKQRPISNGIATVDHSFGFAIGRRDRSGVEMIASDHNRRLDFATFNKLVHGDTKFSALTVAKPANPGG